MKILKFIFIILLLSFSNGLSENSCDSLIQSFRDKNFTKPVFVTRDSILLISPIKDEQNNSTDKLILRLYNIDNVIIFEFNIIAKSRCVQSDSKSALVLSDGQILKYNNSSGQNCEAEYTINFKKGDNDLISLSSNKVEKIRINYDTDFVYVELSEDQQLKLQSIVRCLVSK